MGKFFIGLPQEIGLWEGTRSSIRLEMRPMMITITKMISRENANRLYNQAYSEYKHVLANILRSFFVARTP